MAKRKLSEAERVESRKQFYSIVEQRLDSRLERGETYTSTKDLYKGYEALHDDGFADTQFVAASVSQVLDRAKYRDRLFYARHVVTGRAERVGPGKSAPYKIYLRSDATAPKDFVLVPYSAKGKKDVAEYIAMAKGAEDSTVHHTQIVKQPVIVAGEQPTKEPVVELDLRAVAQRLVAVVKEQADLINELVNVVDALTSAPSVIESNHQQVMEA